MTQTTQINDRSSMLLVGAVLAWTAVIIYASSNSIVTMLTEIGKQHPVEERNAISFCNLLFVGSLFSIAPMTALFWRDWSRQKLRALTGRHWTMLTISALLSSALTPGLFFYALEHTTVTNVVLIGRVEPPLFLLSAVLFLRERLDWWSLAGGLIALVGAVLMISLKEDDVALSLGTGEIAAFFATLSFITSTLITRTSLQGVPLGIFAIYRTVVGTIVYFLVTMSLFGTDHFQDAFAPVVLQYTWIYALVVVLLGQFTWNLGLKYARSGDVSLATSFSPLAAIIIAMVLIGEDPGPGLYPGATIILTGILFGQLGRRRREKAEKRAIEQALELEGRTNFKGV